MKPVAFSKYAEMGAYHWIQCDRRAPNYNPPLEARYRVLVRRVEQVGRILDVGCGDGYLLSQVSRFCERAVGVDSEESGIALARQKLKPFPNCLVTQASCYQIPFPDESFDLTLLADVFEHLEHPTTCLEEIVRLLKSDGRLLLTTPKWRPDRMWDRLHFKEYTPEELLSLLQDYFEQIDLSFFWPMSWYDKYATRLGSKLIRFMLRFTPNPYAQEGVVQKEYGQILAVCSSPRKRLNYSHRDRTISANK